MGTIGKKKTKNEIEYKCPSCKKKFPKSPETLSFLPFCSKRCKMIDLGQWMSEKYVLEGDEATSDTNITDDEQE